MKNLTNKQVAERFAKLYNDGKSGTMFIELGVVYSYGYHFPIAKRISNTEVEFTTDGYSVTTAKHKSLVLKALKENDWIITYKSFK